MVKWQARSRARRLSGMKLTLPVLAVIGAGALLADLLGGVDLTGAAAFAPLALTLPWLAQTVVGMVRSSLDGLPG
jgi:hypothetical protein